LLKKRPTVPKDALAALSAAIQAHVATANAVLTRKKPPAFVPVDAAAAAATAVAPAAAAATVFTKRALS